MNCDDARNLFIHSLNEELDAPAKALLESHLTQCAACREENNAVRSMWTRLSHLPEQKPCAALDDRFVATLEAYREGMNQAESNHHRAERYGRVRSWLWSLWPKQPALQFALAVLLFALGLIIGGEVRGRPQHDDPVNGTAMAELRQEVATMKQLLTLSLLEQPSASERLRGVEWTSRLPEADTQVVSALLRILELDPNVNVRIAAVDALKQLHGHPLVQKGLLTALAGSQPPLVQIDLIDAFVNANNQEAVAVIRVLLENREVDPTVRERAEWALEKLTEEV